MVVTDRCRNEAELAFRRERDLSGRARLRQWMKENGLTRREFDALMADEARLRWFHGRTRFASTSCLPEQLRISGDYARLVKLAMAKDKALKSRGLKNPCLKDAELSEKQLLHWYFEDVLHRRVPKDLNSYARDLGFASADAFQRALLREYLYRRFEDQVK
jgi:AraC-like DNA-binding protein